MQCKVKVEAEVEVWSKFHLNAKVKTVSEKQEVYINSNNPLNINV